MFSDLNSKFYVIILGALLMLSVYHFIIFIQYKKKLYLSYSLYTIALSIYLIALIPEISPSFKIVNPAIQFLIFAFYINFSRLILDTKTKNQTLDSIFKYGNKVFLMLTIFFLIAHILFTTNLVYQIYLYILPIGVLYIILAYVLIFRLKGKHVVYFIIGSLSYVVGSAISFTLAPTTGEVSDSYFMKFGIHPLFFMYIGIIIEALVFAILAGYKTKKLEIEKITAEKNIEIEHQKLANVLKEQELITIDAMIEGQEKERQRIANDLHDDLGGLMANVKLHFNALKDKKSPDLFDRTNILIDEAYQRVRSVAHAKNSGVIAKQGLLKAVQNMADKISDSNKIQIEVLDHGLDNRLENSLELTLFRMIQELITNVIKHAEASEVTIHLTNHEDSINIMVEDNGKGFNTRQINKTNSGMGISSIDKRVEHLEGKLVIESEKNIGTTIIIDIPL